MATVTVAIPWREKPDRVRPYQVVRKFWADVGFPVVDAAPTDAGPFNLSQARNNAVRLVASDLVIVADADVLPDISVVREALATIHGEVVYLYDDYRIIGPEWVDSKNPWQAPRQTCFCGQMLPRCCGQTTGLLACRTETYWRLGGHDERFGSHWGGEDLAFAMCANTLSGVRRVPGLAVAFNHEQERDVTDVHPLLAAYEKAEGDPDAMDDLIWRQAWGVEDWQSKWPNPPVGQPHWPPRPEGVPWL